LTARAEVQRWLDAYVDAWRSYDAEAIGALFSADATYRYHPHDEPLRGRAAIVESWRGERDEPGSWEAAYAPFLLTDEVVIAKGETHYRDGDRFSNLFELRFAPDGRCSDFTEWYVPQAA
jgi:ketosteroid isomerase-like protein